MRTKDTDIPSLFPQWIRVFWHLSAWFLLMVLPLLFLPNQWQQWSLIFQYYWSWVGLAMLLFYLNYFWLYRQLKRNNGLVAVGLNVAAVVISWLLMREVMEAVAERHLFPLILAVVAANAIRGNEYRWLQNVSLTDQAQQNLQAELQFLRFQLQPHFFFNSLNDIYTIIDFDPTKAKEMVYGLSKLMRYMLYETQAERVSLQQEVTFIRQYLAFMQLRLSEKHQLVIDFPESIGDQQIAPLLLIPLVENAFKHGVSKLDPGTVSLQLEITEEQLFFRVQNPIRAEEPSRAGEGGIGLENLRKRLKLQYPDHQLNLKYLEDKYFRADLRLFW